MKRWEGRGKEEKEGGKKEGEKKQRRDEFAIFQNRWMKKKFRT